MSLVANTLHSLVEVFDRLSIPYAVMGGIAVRAYGVPRPTYDVDATIAIERTAVAPLFDQLRQLDYEIPEPYEKGWVNDVKGLR